MITYPNVKVNLGLSVLRKRPDGYHDLETLFVPCFDIHDTLEIISGDDFSRTSASLFERYPGVPEVPVPENCATLGHSNWLPPNWRSRPSVLPGLRGASDDAFASLKRGGGPSEKLGGGPKDIFRDGTPPEDRLSIWQGIREDGKLMITIARKEGVDWEPLEDLTARDYGLLDADFDLPPVKIFLEKTAPVGAGLGGGSADAAFALRMLSELFALGLDEAALAAYAARLGSDCAFFVYNRPMIGTGRGEILEPCDIDLSQYVLRVDVPVGVSVSTADAYRGIVPREAAAAGRACPLREALSRPVAEWRDCLVNDFEATVFAKYPAIADAKQALYDAGATYASMSGSGSAVFGLFPK